MAVESRRDIDTYLFEALRDNWKNADTHKLVLMDPPLRRERPNRVRVQLSVSPNDTRFRRK